MNTISCEEILAGLLNLDRALRNSDRVSYGDSDIHTNSDLDANSNRNCYGDKNGDAHDHCNENCNCYIDRDFLQNGNVNRHSFCNHDSDCDRNAGWRPYLR